MPGTLLCSCSNGLIIGQYKPNVFALNHFNEESFLIHYELVTWGKDFWSLPRESFLKWSKYEFRNSLTFLRVISRLLSSGSVKKDALTVVYSVLYTRCIVYSLKDMVHIANFTMKISKIELWMIVDRFLKEILCMLGGHVLALKQFLKQ